MRIIHTSDWHLGRTLHGVDLLDHQAAYLDHLIDLVRSETVDAVVVAGDVYDRAIPPVPAVELLSDTLRRLAEHTTVVLSSGNHDSAVRLGFGAAVMRPEIHVRSAVADVGTPVVLPTAAGAPPVLAYALPYLDPDACRRTLADGDEPLARSHEAVTAAALARVSGDLAARRRTAPGTRALVMAHTFVVGGDASDSERDITVGGVHSVRSGLFAGQGLDYVALGHLHGPQTVAVPGDDAPVARYSGSPLAYSFSEMHQKKSTVLLSLGGGTVDVRGDAAPEVELVPAPVPRRLTEVRGTLDEVLGAAGDDHVDDWLRVVVTDTARPRDLVAQVRQRFPHALQIHHQPDRPAGREAITVVAAHHDPLDVARDFVDHVTGQAPTPAENEVLRTALEAAAASERSA
ncbi:exonuclease SbcCD subunit D [Paraoerskovia marina]|uniref:exonuclease SbcCD subunit D n=1 Tax=Paraoerskovia marina TaxID=545619 RepID=UPI000492A02F|nr:exonuclease SbcCD subunit D [Paraoerskovia marina]